LASIDRNIHYRRSFLSAGSKRQRDFQGLLAQLESDIAASIVVMLPLTDTVIDRIVAVFATASATTYLRAADALHLATAAENGFTEIYSSDAHLLAAAPLFGLAGVNVIPGEDGRARVRSTGGN
jgi:predicted nucleic acid-binding protein